MTEARQPPPQSLIDLGFRLWNKSGLLLVPLDRLPKVPRSFMLTCINGGEKLPADEVDHDTRGGLLAWGVTPDEYEIAEGWFR